MRDLEECKAEVFRRSKERIKARKKMKQRTVICCASLCVVLVVGMILPKLGPVDELFGIERDGAVGSMASEYASVRSTKDGSSYQLHYRTSDKEMAQGSYDVVVGFFEGEFTAKDDVAEDTAKDYELGGCAESEELDRDMTGTEGKDTTTGEIKYQMNANATCGSAGQATIYEVIFRIEEGEAAVFRLSGNELTDVTNNRKIVLTEEQLSTLKTQFEITEE